MKSIVRFSVSLEKQLLQEFDRHTRLEKYPTRSKAVVDLIREKLVRKEWEHGTEVAGTITLVYDHHGSKLMETLTCIQHDFHHIILASQHIPLDHNNCLEVVVVRGVPGEVKRLSDLLRATKGVKFANLSMATTGKIL
jgi:CopG family nickel-responsive transcriptional regulator